MISGYARPLIAASLLPLSAAFAQDSNDSPAPDEMLLVTAARTPLDPRRVGSAATVITRDEIEQSRLRYLSDILRSVPGFAISQSGGVGAQTQARVRGGEANQVLVMIDGVRANDPATGDEFRFEHLSLGNVERIEIVRGPQSALWGSDAVSGVINIITRQGQGATDFGGFVEAGSNDTTNFGVTAGTGQDDWSLTGSLESLDTDGTNIARSGSEADGADLVTAGLAFRLANPDGIELDISLRASDGTSQYDDVDFFVSGLPIDTDHETDSSNLVGRVGAALRTHDDRVAWDLSLGYFDSRHTDFVNGSAETFAGSERTTFGLQASIDLDVNLLTLALEHENTDFEQRGPVVFGDPNQRQDLNVVSAVAEYQYLASERWTWIIGARHDSNSDFDDALTGRISLSYSLSDRTRLRLGVGTGQKAPTFIERFGFFPDDFVGNPDLKPESSVSYDIGIDHSFADRAVTISASLYRQELEDEIDGFALDPVSFQFTAVNLPGRSERDGLELVARWEIDEAMTLGANWTYADATQPDGPDEQMRELRRPRHSGGLSFNWAPMAQDFALNFAASYGGRRDDEFFPPFPQPSQIVSLDDYWLVDLAAQYRLTPSLTLFARGANLLDETYEEVYGYATPGRTAYVGVRMNFAGR